MGRRHSMGRYSTFLAHSSLICATSQRCTRSQSIGSSPQCVPPQLAQPSSATSVRGMLAAPLTTADRPLPNCEYLAPFVVADKDLMAQHPISMWPRNSQISYEDWETLSEEARHLTRFVRAEKGVEVKPDVVYKVLSF